MEVNPTQQLFFNHIRSKMPPHLSFVDEMAGLLNISNDSAYRRIRGEKPMGLDEMQVLCNKYHVSLDQLLQIQTNAVIFSGNKVDTTNFRFNDYLNDVANNLMLFKALPGAKMYFFTKDLPIFHFMQFPELSAFKFFFWKRTIISEPELARMQFTGKETDDETVETAKKIIELYTELPSIELWSEESVHITIRQIEYYRQSNIFADKDILIKVYAQLEELLDHIERQAETGKKFLYSRPNVPDGARYDLYINECLIGDNTIFVESNDRQITVLNHNGLNFISTQDKSFCDYTLKNLQNIMRRSTPISLTGEKDRSIFFNSLREKIYDRKKNTTDSTINYPKAHSSAL
ncbi:MAG: hypothetical protein ACHQF4_11800 [Sphingobacteriales bacterium]